MTGHRRIFNIAVIILVCSSPIISVAQPSKIPTERKLRLVPEEGDSQAGSRNKPLPTPIRIAIRDISGSPILAYTCRLLQLKFTPYIGSSTGGRSTVQALPTNPNTRTQSPRAPASRRCARGDCVRVFGLVDLKRK